MRSRSRCIGGSAARSQIALLARDSARAVGDVAAGAALTRDARWRRRRRAAASRSAASRCRPTFRSDCGAAGPTSIFRSTGIVFPAPRSARRRCRAATAAPDPLRPGASDDADLAGLARVPARRSAAARRVEGGRARRRVVHQGVRRRAAAAARSCSTWDALPRTLDVEARLVAADRVGARGGARRAAVRADAARHRASAAARDAIIAAPR